MTETAHWFRWHHGTTNDPKWQVVANRASHAMSRRVTRANVLAVWAAMMECASKANPRGTLEGWSDEDVGAGLDLEESEVAAIRTAMSGKTLEPDAKSLTAWEKRQPKRERDDPGAAERQARKRERDLASKGDVTPSHATSRHVTPRGEERREEKKDQEQEKPSPSGDGSVGESADPARAPSSVDQKRAERLAEVARDAIETFNASGLVKPKGGALPTVKPLVGFGKRQRQVSRCIKTAREICTAEFGEPKITRDFWAAYWSLCASDPFLSGRTAPGKGHENWLPDFEFLTREATLLKTYDRSETAA